MTFRNFIRILIARWKLALTAVLACVIGAAFVTAVQTRQYEASATVLVTFSGAANLNEFYNGTLASQERLSSYAQIAGGRAVVERAISQLQLPVSAQDVMNQLTVDYTVDSLLFTITIKDTDPQRAAMLVGAIAEQFGAIVPTLGMNSQPTIATDPRPDIPGLAPPPGNSSPRGQATIVEAPRVPDKPVSPVPTRNIAVGLLAGLLLGIAVAVIRESTDRTVHNRNGLGEFPDYPVLAELPGRRGRAPRFGSDGEYDNAVHGLAARLRSIAGSEGRSVLLVAPAGGEGTTTTALNLSYVLAEIGEDVLLVEGDGRRPAIARMLNVDSETGLVDVVADSAIATDAMQPTHVSKLFVLASSADPSPTSLSSAHPAETIDHVLTDLSSRFDRIVVDGPPVLATADAGLLASAAQATVLVIRARRTTVDDVREAMAALRAANANVVGIVLTGARPSMRTRAATQNYRASASGRT